MKNKVALSLVVILSLLGCTNKTSDSSSAQSVASAGDKLVELQQTVETSPSYENHIALGMELANRNRFDEAVVVYEKAVQINPKASIAQNNICAAFNAQGRFADAIDSCEKAVALEPNFELAQNNLKFAKEKFTMFRTELMAKKPELIRSAKTSEAQLDVGMQLFLARDLEAAKNLWSKVPPNDPYYAAALNNIASSQIIEGKFDEAEISLSKAISLQPDNQLFTNNKRWLESKKLSR